MLQEFECCGGPAEGSGRDQQVYSSAAVFVVMTLSITGEAMGACVSLREAGAQKGRWQGAQAVRCVEFP